METESLAVLKAAFDEWRRGKQHDREAFPAPLLARARAAARHHGPAAVFRATKVSRGRLATGHTRRARGATKAVPAFSRIELAPPATTAFAEVETSTGWKVRLFAPTTEALGLLSSIFDGARGGAR